MTDWLALAGKFAASIDWSSFSLGGALGAALKWVLERFEKARTHKKDARRREARECIRDAQARIEDCLKCAMAYYVKADPSARSAAGTDVRHSIRMLGMAFNAANVAIVDLKGVPLDSGLLIRFRQAVTLELDKHGAPARDACGALVVGCYSHAEDLRKAYSAVVRTLMLS